MSNTCIRILADPVQIKDCKETLKRLDGKLTDITKVFNLSGNGARFKILFLLHQEGKMCPCDLSDILSISVGGVSQHLRKLKDGGLVKDKRVGQTIFYSMVPESVQMLLPILNDMTELNRKETIK